MKNLQVLVRCYDKVAQNPGVPVPHANFCLWLQADLQSPEIDFCFTPKSRHSRGRH